MCEYCKQHLIEGMLSFLLYCTWLASVLGTSLLVYIVIIIIDHQGVVGWVINLVLVVLIPL